MESSIPNEQKVIQTTSDVFWIIQFTWNIPKNDEQYLPRTTPQRNIGKLHERLHYTNKNDEGTRRKDNLIFEDCRKTQFVF